MNLWNGMAGMLTVEITSAEPSEALYALNAQGIVLRDVCSVSDLSVRFSVSRQDLADLRKVLSRRGDTMKILRRSGMYWRASALIHRPILLFGMAALIILALYFPSRIFFVCVEGNTSIPDRLILSMAEECGITFGASRREVRSEKMKNALLEAIPQLQWAGVNTSGCVATISVREKTMQNQTQQDLSVGSIVAVRDGVIRQCTVVKGNSLCRVGQAVKAGDVLVSGYTDCGTVIKATRADAEIIAETTRTLQAVTPSVSTRRGRIIKEEVQYYVRIGKNIINFNNDSGISDSTCVKMYEENYMTLPGGFQLPIALVCETRIYYEVAEYNSGEADAPWLEVTAADYLHSQMIAGQILGSEVTCHAEGGFCSLIGEYACLEMIGRVQSEEILGKYENS